MEYRIKQIKRDKLYKNLSDELQHELVNIAVAIMDIPRGTMMIENFWDEETKERFLKLILSTPLKDNISSLTFSEEHIFFLRNDKRNKKLVLSIKNQGYILGFYASRGEQLFPQGEVITVGIDNLLERCQEYKHYGFKFAIWKNFIRIGNNIPSYYACSLIAKNSAEFAAICQSQCLVPIVGFEIGNEGAYTIEQAKNTLENVLSITFRSFGEKQVFLDGLIIQTTLVKSGNSSEREDTPKEIADATLDALSRTVVTGTKGIQILTGNLQEQETKENLNALFNSSTKRTPWLISFAVGRNLENYALAIWKEKSGNETQIRKSLIDVTRRIMKALAGN